jgi:hypothetical protein
MPNPSGIKKPFRETGRAWIRLMPGAKMRALSHPVELRAVGPGHSRREQRTTKNHVGISCELAQSNTPRQKYQIRLCPPLRRALARGEHMAIEDDDKPRKKVTHEIGQDLSLLSVEELTVLR